MKLVLAVTIAAVSAFGQGWSPPSGGGGSSSPNVYATAAGPATTLAINLTGLGLTSTTLSGLTVQCYTGTTTLTPLDITLTSISTTSATANFSSSSNITCVANGGSGGLAPGISNPYFSTFTGTTATIAQTIHKMGPHPFAVVFDSSGIQGTAQINCKTSEGSTVGCSDPTSNGDIVITVTLSGTYTYAIYGYVATSGTSVQVNGQNCVLGDSCTVSVTSLALSALAAQAADTVVANSTGSSAAPTAVSIPNCATGLTYSTSGHALGCVSAVANSLLSTSANTYTIPCTFDGGGSTITTNAISYNRVPVASHIVGWAIDAVGSSPGITITLLGQTASTTLPTTDIADLAGTHAPRLTSTDNATKSTTLTGWTTALAADYQLACKVTTSGNATWARLTVYLTKD